MTLKIHLGIATAFAFALAAGAPSATAQTTSRLIVKLRDSGTLETQSATSGRLARVVTESAGARVTITHQRAMALGAHVLTLDHPLSSAEASALVARLAQHPDVEFVQADHRRRAQLVPNDTYVSTQTYLQNSPGGISAIAAWDTTTGSPSTVVAIVDSGYRPHADLAGRILPGYDFIGDIKAANDGDGRDPDATDPGDWISSADTSDPEFDGCDVENSSWHGTAVAGIVAADANNGQWLAGVDWATQILPVRVLGKCGGRDSDILDGVAWAAGIPVPGVPENPHPAQVINLSLGGEGSCPAGYVSVFGAALAHGVTRAIVVSAGNDGGDVADSAPANCPQVIAVAATSKRGSLAGYSNSGAGITLSAPGGVTFGPAGDTIVFLSNTGTTTPAADSFDGAAGTSFSAPMVAGVVSLMLAVAPNLTAAEVRSLLTSSAKPFPIGSTCDTSLCGAGIVNAQAAVVAAQSGAPAANYQGLWWNAPANSESGWGINFAHQGDTIFASWFTYDVSGRGWWLVMTAPITATNTYTGTLYQTHGPPFNAVPFSPLAVTNSAVGTGTLTFIDANNGTFAYTVNGTSQTKNITRQVFGRLPTCTFGAQSNLALATNYQDLWWNAPAASESGWGVNFTHQGNQIFVTWFTYDLDGSPLWLVTTATQTHNPALFTGTLYRTSGTRFDAFDPASVVSNAVGSVTLTLADGNTATFAYTVQLAGMAQPASQNKTITREVFMAPGTVCR